MCKGPEVKAGLDVLEAMQEVQLGWSKDAWETTGPDELLLKAVNEPLAFLRISSVHDIGLHPPHSRGSRPQAALGCCLGQFSSPAWGSGSDAYHSSPSQDRKSVV